MTAHVHDPAAPIGTPGDAGVPARIPATLTRPWWLLPGIVGALVVGGLVVAGVVSLSVVLYVGLFGGMILMHSGGHGHGGHGGGQIGRGHSLHGDGADDVEDLSRRSSGAQANESGSATGLDQRARDNATTSETRDHDQHGSHGCH